MARKDSSLRNFGLYASELRLSLRNNSGAYGYSVMITCTLAMISAIRQTPTPWQVILFLLGAAVSFAIIEATATQGFTRKLTDEESPEVVALGSSLSFISITLSVAFAALWATLILEPVVWLVGSFFASITYLVVSGVEMAAARRIEEARNVE